jgi:hypothetical protein
MALVFLRSLRGYQGNFHVYIFLIISENFSFNVSFLLSHISEVKVKVSMCLVNELSTMPWRCMGEWNIASLFLTLVLDGDEWLSSHCGCFLLLVKEHLLPIGYEDGWAPETVWMLYRRYKFFFSARNWTPAIQPIAILTELSCLPVFCICSVRKYCNSKKIDHKILKDLCVISTLELKKVTVWNSVFVYVCIPVCIFVVLEWLDRFYSYSAFKSIHSSLLPGEYEHSSSKNRVLSQGPRNTNFWCSQRLL